MNITTEVNTNLEDLVYYLQDSRNGYKECAENIDSQLMKNLFLEYSKKRDNMLDTLKTISEDKKIFQANGTLKGKMHQVFVNLKAFIVGKNVDSIVAEIKNGETFLLDKYRDVLMDDNIPFNLKAILRDQMEEIESDLANITKKTFDFTD